MKWKQLSLFVEVFPILAKDRKWKQLKLGILNFQNSVNSKIVETGSRLNWENGIENSLKSMIWTQWSLSCWSAQHNWWRNNKTAEHKMMKEASIWWPKMFTMETLFKKLQVTSMIFLLSCTNIRLNNKNPEYSKSRCNKTSHNTQKT